MTEDTADLKITPSEVAEWVRTFQYTEPPEGIELLRRITPDSQLRHFPIKEVAIDPKLLEGKPRTFAETYAVYKDVKAYTASNFKDGKTTGEFYTDTEAVEFIICNPKILTDAVDVIMKDPAISEKNRDVLEKVAETLKQSPSNYEEALKFLPPLSSKDEEIDEEMHPLFVLRIAMELVAENPQGYTIHFTQEGPTAGDENNRRFYKKVTSPLDLTRYPIDIKRAQLRLLMLPKYREQGEFMMEIGDTRFPLMSVAVTYGSRSDVLVDLAPDPLTGEVSQTKLISVSPHQHTGKGIMGKGASFIRHTKEVVDTGETLLPTGKQQLGPPPEILLEAPDEQFKRYAEPLSEAGLEVTKEKTTDDEGGLSYYSINLPAQLPDDMIKVLEMLDSASIFLRTVSQNMLDKQHDPDVLDIRNTALWGQIRTLDLRLSRQKARQMAWPGHRDETSEFREFVANPENRKKGDGLFYDIQGFGNLRAAFKHYDLLFGESSDEEAEEITSELIAGGIARLSQEVSKHTIKGRFLFENIEVNEKDAVRMILNRGILEPDLIHPGKFTDHPELLQYIKDSVNAIFDPEFEAELARYLGELYVDRRYVNLGGTIREQRIQEVVDIVSNELTKINFKVNVALGSCEIEPDNLSWYISNNPLQRLAYMGGVTIFGPLTSTIARTAMVTAHDNVDKIIKALEIKISHDSNSKNGYEESAEHKTDQKRLEVWRSNRPSLKKLSKGSNLVVQKEVAQALGLINEESVVLDDIVLKGTPPLSRVYIPLRAG